MIRRRPSRDTCRSCKREYAFWMEGAERLRPGTAHRHVVALADGSILNRYWDDRDTPRDESYRDDTELARASGRAGRGRCSATFAPRPKAAGTSARVGLPTRHTRATIDTTEIVPIDLNSLLFGLENAIRAGCERGADEACARRICATRRGAARCDRSIPLGCSAAAPISTIDGRSASASARVSAATLYPLFVALASERQAAAVAKIAARNCCRPGGIVTTTLETGAAMGRAQRLGAACSGSRSRVAPLSA